MLSRLLPLLLLLPLLAAGEAAPLPKILIIDSYHDGYPWADGQVKGAQAALAGKAVVTVTHMDSKRQPGEAAKQAAGERIRAEIAALHPDLVIAADDNAQRYVVIPQLKGGPIPVVFCGINWDATAYGYPCPGITGMLEVALVQPLIANLKRIRPGATIAILGADDESDRSSGGNMERLAGVAIKQVYVTSFDAWRQAFSDLQADHDFLILLGNAGLAGWDDTAAAGFVLQQARVPIGTTNEFMAPYALLTCAKIPEEQGEWAAQAALRILAGTPTQDIPIAMNTRSTIYLHSALAERMHLHIPLDLVKLAKGIDQAK